MAQVRLTAADIEALTRSAGGPGTSAAAGVQTTILSGNPAVPGPYAIELRVPPQTRIASHSHRDNRTAFVVSGEWNFGYGEQAAPAATTRLGAGSFYTEPAGVAHVAWTGSSPAVIYITGDGPTDTHYTNTADEPKK